MQWTISYWINSINRLRQYAGNYDVNGNFTNEQTTLADGKVDVNSTIKTDAKGNKIEQEDIRPGGKVLFNYKYRYHYDKKGS